MDMKQLNIQKQIDEFVATAFTGKLSFNVLLISDEDSRLSILRGYNAFSYVKKAFSSLGVSINITSMGSADFCRNDPDITKFDVVWIDNVENAKMTFNIADKLDDYASSLVGTNVFELDEENQALARKLRSLHLRVIYALDEFVWNAPAGRQKKLGECLLIEDALYMSDIIVVPTRELQQLLFDCHLVDSDKDVVSIPSFVSDWFYPVHKIFNRSSNYSTSIRTPKILVKGVILPKNVQEFIVQNYKEYSITICSVVDLRKDIYKLIQEGKVSVLQHWASPFLKKENLLETMAYERDYGFDFVINTVPPDISEDPYEIANLDTDCIIAVAEGAVAIAGVKDAKFSPESHICVACGLVYGSEDPASNIRALVERYRRSIDWDTAYQKQRLLLNQRLVSSQSVVGGYFHAMLGRTLSNKYANQLSQMVAKQKASAK